MGKNDRHILCQERHEISLTLISYWSIIMMPPVEFSTGQFRAKPGKKNKGLLESLSTPWVDKKICGENDFFSFFRYRFAAVPGHFKRAEDPRLRPRASHKLFHNTSLLSKDRLKFQTVLNVWFGNEQQEWQLLYRASKDGFSAASFHTKCDGHSPTLTVVLVSKIWRAPIVEANWPVSKLFSVFWRQGGKRKKSFQLCLWNLNICIEKGDVKC